MMMKFTGLLLKESLKDASVLKLVKVTKTETWDVDKAADYQPKIWTAIYFEGKKSEADPVAKSLSLSLKPRWYTNISTDTDVFVIFPGQVFKYTKGDTQKEKEGDPIRSIIRHSRKSARLE